MSRPLVSKPRMTPGGLRLWMKKLQLLKLMTHRKLLHYHQEKEQTTQSEFTKLNKNLMELLKGSRLGLYWDDLTKSMINITNKAIYTFIQKALVLVRLLKPILWTMILCLPKTKSQKYTCIQLQVDLASTANIHILVTWTWKVRGWNILPINVWNILI